VGGGMRDEDEGAKMTPLLDLAAFGDEEAEVR
jgi:hypothetical protein